MKSETARRACAERGEPRLSRRFCRRATRGRGSHFAPANERLELLEGVFEALPFGMAIAYGADCHTMRANATLRAMLGVESDRNVSKSADRDALLPFRIVRDGQEIRPEDLPMQKAAREGLALRGNRFEYYRQDGRVLVLQSDVEPWRSADGRAQGSIGVFTDITEIMTELKRLRSAVSRFDPVTGLVRICSSCRKVADLTETWSTLEVFLARNIGVRYTHGLCPDCFDRAMRLIDRPASDSDETR